VTRDKSVTRQNIRVQAAPATRAVEAEDVVIAVKVADVGAGAALEVDVVDLRKSMNVVGVASWDTWPVNAGPRPTRFVKNRLR
jgi:hypothetical protein